jgi:hypothetical protein
MNKRPGAKLKGRIFLCLILALSATAGCSQGLSGRQILELPPSPAVKKIALIGFKTAIYKGNEADFAAIEGSPGLPENTAFLTSKLLEIMAEHKGCELLGTEITAPAFSGIASSGGRIGNLEIAGRTARELEADGAVIGLLYRWREREGSDYAVNSPASVFFELFLVSAENGSIMWKGRFNKTQRSLSENLLDIRTFFRGKGKWMTADDLALMGLNDLTKDLILFIEKGREEGN